MATPMNTLSGPRDILSIITELLGQQQPQARTLPEPQTLQTRPAMPGADDLLASIQGMGQMGAPGTPSQTKTGAPVTPSMPTIGPSAEDMAGRISRMGPTPEPTLQPLTEESITPRPQVGQEYAPPPAETPSPTPEASTVRPPPLVPRSGGDERPTRGVGDYVMAFLSGLSGEGGLRAVRGMADQSEQRNATYDALIGKGLDPTMARAMVMDPKMLAAVLPSLLSPKTSVVNNRLVDTRTGAILADFSDAWKPLPEGSAGSINASTGEFRPAPGGGTSPKPPAGYEWVDPSDRSKGLRAIPGGPATQISSDVAGRLALMNNARRGIQTARQVYERAWGAGDFARQGAANIPVVGDVSMLSGEQGLAQREIRTAVEAVLRTMTGAAAPEQEVERYAALFTPTARDTVESAKQKLNNLDNFMAEAERLVTQGRSSAPAGPSGGASEAGWQQVAPGIRIREKR